MPKAPRALKTRNANTWTEAGYWGKIRSGLRRMFRHNWMPARAVLEAARRPYFGPNTRQKWEFKCAVCGTWHIRKHVEIDHLVPCGSLRCIEDIGPFLAALHCEDPAGYQVICKKCHLEKTKAEREARKSA
jgi:hypothetical protein